jgi:tetratricopeptide (TPR) repeat protein
MKRIYLLRALQSFSATARRAFILAILCVAAISCSYAQQKEAADEHSNRAHALSVAGNLKGAIAEYQVALRVDPNSVEALNNLALLYATASDASLRDPAKALKYALQAVALDNAKMADHLDTLAKAYDANGDHENAVAIEQRAVNLLAEDSTRRLTFETSLAGYQAKEGTVPTDTASFVSYCPNHIEGCRHVLVDVNNINMMRQIGGNRGCTIPHTGAGTRADSKDAMPKILDWMNANRASLAQKSDVAIEQAMAALWPSECKD